MIRRVVCIVVLLAGCSAPPPAPAPTPPAVVVAAPTVAVTLSPTAPPAPSPSAAVVVEPAEPSESPSPEPTSAPPALGTPEAAPTAGLATPSPVPATPTAIALESFTPPDEIGALAGAPAVPAATLGPAGGPTAVVLPPSARLQVGLTPTPNVLASSPSLGAVVGTSGSADYAGASKLAQDSRKTPGAPRLSERIDAAVARVQAAGSQVEVEGWQAALKGSTDVYQVTFALRENRQGLRAEWEVNLATGEVRPVNPLAETLDAT
jgi:hypothetical protein